MSISKIIHYSGIYAGQRNMALDEAILMNLLPDDTAVLRTYEWAPPTVTIGYFQSMEAEVDVRKCAEKKIPVIRRITGGGAVFHNLEVTYSFICDRGCTELQGTIIESYKRILDPVIAALAKAGVAAEFSPLNDLTASGKKISGNAQTRRHGKILHFGRGWRRTPFSKNPHP